MSCTELMKQAALRRLLEATIEPDWAIKRRFLVHQQMLQLGGERLQRVIGREVPLVLRPMGNRVDDTTDELLDAPLAFGSTELAPKVFRHHDVGRLLRPDPRNLDVTLLKNDLALLVSDHRRAGFPFDLIKRIDTREGEVA